MSVWRRRVCRLVCDERAAPVMRNGGVLRRGTRRTICGPLFTARRRVERSAVMKLVLLTVVCILTGSGVYYMSEWAEGRECTYGECLQEILILLLSGFDIDSPRSASGVVSAFCVLTFGIIFVTLLTSELAANAVEKRLKKGSGAAAVKWHDHIIICGWDSRVDTLVPQLRSEDTERPWQIVIISEDLEANPYDDVNVQFVRGDPARDEVLKRANVNRARAAIVLGDPRSKTAGEQDAHAILTALAVKYIAPGVYTCVELADPENEKHLRHANVDEVVCPQLLGTCMLVQATLNPGLTRFLQDILTFDEGMEIYKAPVSPQTAGRTYGELAVRLMMKHGVTAVALEREGEMTVNPPAQTLIEEQDCVWTLALDYPGFISELRWDGQDAVG